MRSIPFYPLLVILLVGLGGYLGCDPGTLTPPLTSVGNAPNQPVQTASSVNQRQQDRILIGSFNVQRLGPSKMRNAVVMNRLAQIVLQFDIIALQEITDSSGLAAQELLRQVNATGARYEMAESPRIGRPATGYFEQYAFLFDTQRIAGGREFCYVVQDELDLLHREPYVGRFQTRTANPFSFSLINIHTDPDEINRELDVLATVLVNVRNFEYQQCGHDDVILLGDLNAGPGRLRGLEQIPNLVALIRQPTNVRKNKMLDNILIDQTLTTEFTGRAGVLDTQDFLGIDLNEAIKTSDHLPVWAEFYATRGATHSASMSASRTAVDRR